MTRKVSVTERQGRLVERHRLGGPGTAMASADSTTSADSAAPADSAGSVAEVASALVALHATDPVTVYLSARARSGCTAQDVDTALYAERSVVRMLGMRRTVFVVPAELGSVVQAACTDDVAKRMRRGMEKDLAGGGIGDGDPGGWLRSVEDGVLRALAARGGGASGAQLGDDEPRLRTQLTYAPGKSYGGPANITSRVLILMAAEGRMIRGHRRGGWTSGQFEWWLPAAWLRHGDGGAAGATAPAGDGSAGVPSEAVATAGAAAPAGGGGARVPSDGLDAGMGAGLDASAARAELARRWLTVFGPAPASDLQWWAGWTGAQTKAALSALPVTEVDLDGQPGVVLADDLEFPADAPPAAALLPALDPTPMGWQSRSWYLGPHAAALFDRTGNIGPTVWWAGRVVGGWAQRASGEVTCRLLEDIGADGALAVAAEAAALEAWLGPARVTPRFRTPLERELVS